MNGATQTDKPPPRHKALSVMAENIPAELKELDQWVTWKYEFRDKWTKPPYQVNGSDYAKSSDPATWGAFHAALKTYQGRQVDGIGIVLAVDTGIVGVDLDHCYNPQTKSFEVWATKIIEHFNSYTEASPSGTGVRIFLKGKLPAGGRKKGNVEIYSSGRYLTVTGRVLRNKSSRAIEPRQPEIDAFLLEHFPPESKSKPNPSRNGNGAWHPSDDELLEKAFAAKNGDKLKRLFAGDTSEHNDDDSAADLALCNHLAFWSQDEAQIDRIFRRSGLMRDKWDEKHGAGTYGELTMEKALAGKTEHYEPRKNSNSSPKQVKPDEWPEPLPLVIDTKSEPYPLDALPETVHAAVVEVQQFTKAPVALVASSALAALSAAIQAHADMKRAEMLSGPVALFLLTIADSGERKSTCDRLFTDAIRQYEAEQTKAGKPKIKEYKAALDAWEAKRAGIKDKIRQLAKKKESTDEYERTLHDLEADKPKAPRVPRLIYTDATPEALKWNLATAWPSAGVICAEAGIVFGSHGMGKDNIMRNLTTLNELWDGRPISTDRRTTESFTVRGARLTLGLQVQEVTLRSFFDRSNGLPRGTGFMARFLIAWPESTQGSRRFTEVPADSPGLSAFNRSISNILNKVVPIDDDGALTPPMLGLTPEAKTAWVTFHDAIESKLASGGELYDVRDVASKSADNAVRLSALLQIFENETSGPIEAEAFENASRIVAWHLNESRRFFGELALPVEIVNAAHLDKWLVEYCRQNQTKTVPTRTVQQFGPARLREKSALDAALFELEELGRARTVKDGRRRIIDVNPALIGGDKT